MQKKVLGRGLSALMPEKLAESGSRLVNINIDKIKVGKFQPRQEISAQRLEELMASIKEKGVIQPILLRAQVDGYELIAGERRFRAAQKLGFTQLPAIIKDVPDDEALQLSLIENIQREELNALEEAQAYQQLINQFGYSQEKIAQLVGKNPSSVSNTLRLLKLPPEIQAALRQGRISMGHARTILAIESLDEQGLIFKRALGEHLSVRELEHIVSQKSPKALKRKRLTLRDPNLVSMEEQLQRILGTKVRIAAGRKRGKIIIEYYSLSDLERLIKLLKRTK
ncbi:MAG: ParB/RepB/Spo0J family partition protein [Candidatus Omnitrophica bacterium]|nr:ParB/RepB/Spo0J family partition protein [Candidatus Omnitrophota bacterium]